MGLLLPPSRVPILPSRNSVDSTPSVCSYNSLIYFHPSSLKIRKKWQNRSNIFAPQNFTPLIMTSSFFKFLHYQSALFLCQIIMYSYQHTFKIVMKSKLFENSLLCSSGCAFIISLLDNCLLKDHDFLLLKFSRVQVFLGTLESFISQQFYCRRFTRFLMLKSIGSITALLYRLTRYYLL